jgi:hypothetical protein
MDLDRNHWRTAGLYMGSVVLVNVGFSLSPQLDWLWSLVVGGVLVLRDLVQRSWGHRTVLLMLLAAAISYRLAKPQLALASALAFLVSETIDWGVYSLTHRPFADRVLLSVALSAPVDTALFLHLANLWSWPLFGLGLGAKLMAGIGLSQVFRGRLS